MIWLGTGKWRLMKEKSRCRAIWGIVRKVVLGRFSAIYKLLYFKAQLSFLSVFLTSLISLKYYHSITYNILEICLMKSQNFTLSITLYPAPNDYFIYTCDLLHNIFQITAYEVYFLFLLAAFLFILKLQWLRI